MIEALVAALVAALAKEAPAALVSLLRQLGVLSEGMSDEDAARRIQSAADILGDTNPMRAIKRRRRVIEIVHSAPEYEDEGGPPSAA